MDVDSNLELLERREALQVFIRTQIQPDLEAAQKHLEMLDQRIHEYQELLERLEGPGILEELAQEQLVDIGGGLYAKFNLCDPRLVSIAVGLGYFVEMPIDDPNTIALIKRKVGLLNRRRAACAEKRNLIDEHLRLMQQGLAALDELSLTNQNDTNAVLPNL